MAGLAAVAMLSFSGLWAMAADPAQNGPPPDRATPARPAVTAPKPATRTCQAPGIEGAWYRADGSALRISGLNADGGREGVFTVHPRAWPRGLGRYSAITQVDGCSFQAICIDARRMPDDSFAITRKVCALTLDPRAGTLSQGAGYSFSRTPSTSAEADARRDAEAELDAQDRASEALNADINGRNADAQARDAARKAEFARRQREYEARKRADAEAYARAQVEYERQKAAVEAQRLRDLREWEARVKACKDGDRTQCAPK
jgi:hypothetical protein